LPAQALWSGVAPVTNPVPFEMHLHIFSIVFTLFAI
jgi:hypothetical protein